jgi:hypothetical protein
MIGRRWAYSLLSAAAMGLMAIGCSGDVGDDKPREPVSGTVTMDGQPLPDGVILFTPAGPAGEAIASATGKIANGEFSIPRIEGPVPGSYKVSISHTDQPEGRVKIELKKPGKKAAAGTKELIPAKYNSQTTLKEEIKKGGASGLKYELQSK